MPELIKNTASSNSQTAIAPLERRFISFDGTPIFYRVFSPATSAHAAVLIVHGLGEHGGRYAEFCDFLARAGFLCLVPDLRGHGLSGGRRVAIKHFSHYYNDLDAMMRLLQSNYGPLPAYLVSHSFGGLLAPAYVSSRRPPAVRGMVLCSPLFQIDWPSWVSGILGRFSPGTNQDYWIKETWLTHDEEALKKYRSDPLIIRRISWSLCLKMSLLCTQYRAIARRISVPTLIVAAGGDRIVSNKQIYRFFNRLAATDKQLVTFPGLHHETLQEVGREKVFEKILAWLMTRKTRPL